MAVRRDSAVLVQIKNKIVLILATSVFVTWRWWTALEVFEGGKALSCLGPGCIRAHTESEE
jgi:hypothetical protein